MAPRPVRSGRVSKKPGYLQKVKAITDFTNRAPRRQIDKIHLGEVDFAAITVPGPTSAAGTRRGTR